jgi:hypothetical protein
MANIGDLLIDKKMKLGLHTYTLHLWGLGQNWGIVADPRPKEMNLLQLMDKAVEWGLDGLHITGCDLETKDDTRLLEVKAGGGVPQPLPGVQLFDGTRSSTRVSPTG